LAVLKFVLLDGLLGQGRRLLCRLSLSFGSTIHLRMIFRRVS
jgi:hypothetical protein